MFHALLLILALSFTRPSEGFSAVPSSNIHRIKSVIVDHSSDAYSPSRYRKGDATTIPIEEVLPIITGISSNNDANITEKVSYASDFVPLQDMSVSMVRKFTHSRHEDCIDLFDGYETNLIRCEVLDETSLNVRWNASWIPAGSTWLYNLADLAGWDVTRKSPDPATIATFSWKSVFGMFQKAFATGNITLPISTVEGNTIVTIISRDESLDESSSNSRIAKCGISLKESLDLVSEADKSRLQNRRVAQELASWIDVSRRPPLECGGIDTDEWAGIVRQRILTGVPGAGALDVDPNEDDSEGGIALFIFGVICLGALALSFEYFIMPEIVGGTGTIPIKCDDAAMLEFGSGYLSECYSPFGDPLYKN